MTRYARSGSTQKHKKMPGDSTPWEEFSKNKDKKGRSFDQKFKGGKITKQTVTKDRFKMFKNGSEEWKNVTHENEMKSLRNHQNVHNVEVSKTPTQNLRVLTQKSDQSTLSVEINNEKSCNRKNTDCQMVESTKILIADSDVIDNPEVPKTSPLSNCSEVKKGKMKRKLVNTKTELQSLSDEPTVEGNSEHETMSKRKRKKLNKKQLKHDKNHLQSQNMNVHSLENNILNIGEKVRTIQTTSISDSESPTPKSEIKKESREKKLENAKIPLQKTSEELNVEGLSNNQIKKELKKRKKLMKKQQKHCDSDPESNNIKKSNEIKNLDDQIVNKSMNDDKTVKDKRNKKVTFIESVRMNREKNGILLLPPKVERKLYMIKKSLKEKGFPGETIKQIIREERRKRELHFRKTFSKTCFNCRQSGHCFADCPSITSSSEQGTGICFKCGSTEHTSFQCRLRIIGYPFAKCFLCKEQGHITRDCPQNKNGVYPKGGKCNICGNVNHLMKDCPSMKKIKNEEEFTVHTIAEGSSIDAEVIEERKEIKTKRAKIVKF